MRTVLLVVLFCLSICQCAPALKSTGDKLFQLRQKMTAQGYDAVVIPPEDEHQSEYVSDYDKRRRWVSDFTGSAGVAVVTKDKAALWTDGRYYIRAEKELDKDFWILMKQGTSGVPIIDEWLVQVLKSGNKVGQNAKFTSISNWKTREANLAKAGLVLTDTPNDLIDQIWTEGRPQRGVSDIKIHDLKYAGVTWAWKMDLVIARMKAIGAEIFVVTALDEVAWLFNLRATDIPYNPMLFAYAIVSSDKNHRLYINESRIDARLRDYLNGTQTRPYNSIFDDIKQVYANKKVWVSPMSSFAIYNAVSNKSLLLNDRASPVRSIKAIKNPFELQNARECQIRDSMHRIRHLHWLENEVKNGKKVTEISSAKELENFQKRDPLFRGLSFGSISAVGSHAADIHFSTSPDEDYPIDRNSVYLLDAGAQYEDCSTDITRTHHFGKPTTKEIFAYTKVLQGSIDLAKMVFPQGVRGRDIDVAARSYLWKSGLDYSHGTGHGIGYYLCIHEAPPRTNYLSNDVYDEAFSVGMFQSDEPGYYEDGKFGIRLETDIEVVEANTTYNFRNTKYLTFSAQTLIPFDRNLIDVSLLEPEQVTWLNTYNERIRTQVAERFKASNERELYEYVMTNTEPFEFKWSGSTQLTSNIPIMVSTLYLIKCLLF